MNLHLVGLPHTETTSEFVTCAYTQKVVKFAKMMTDRGHTVFLYSGTDNEAKCSEHIACFDRTERERWYGVHTQDNLWGNIHWDPDREGWKSLNPRVAWEIRKRAHAGDMLLLITGSQKPIADALPELVACEWGVGYEVVSTPFCAFESTSWRHHVYGLGQIRAGRWYDTVIPNFFDPADFRLADKSDYLLFVGRLIAGKGIDAAAAVARASGLPLVVAGPGGRLEEGRLLGLDFAIDADNIDYVGPVDHKRRADLMAGARALLAPTTYIEPFGGVTVEAMLSGTPAITTDWGAFTETVEEGVTGFRFTTLAEGVRAVEKASSLSPSQIRKRALKRFSLNAVAPQFEAWFDRLSTLRDEGWYTLDREEEAA